MAKAPTGPIQDTASGPDILPNLDDFGRHLRAANRTPQTIRAYSEAVRQLDSFLAAKGMPRAVAWIRREHIEAFIEDQLERLRPASAANRYRSLQQFFRWLAEEGEVTESPMARMSPPSIPEEPPQILRDEQVAALRKATAGTGFDERRDRAILELLLDTGMRRAELAGIKLGDVGHDPGGRGRGGHGQRP